MKRIKLKKWAENLLIVINIIALILLGSDNENISIFLFTHFIAINIFVINYSLLRKYS